MVGLLVLIFPNQTQAISYQIEMTSTGQAYDYLGGDNLLFGKRRITQDLYLGAYTPLGKRDHGFLRFYTGFRLDHDFGISSDEQNMITGTVDGRYQLTLHVATLEVRGLFEFLDLRVGRLVDYGLFGISDYDGGHLGLQLPWGLTLATGFGLRTLRENSKFNPVAHDLDGTSPFTESNSDNDHTFLLTSTLAWLSPFKTLIKASYRRSFYWAREIREERFGGSLDQNLGEFLYLSAKAIYNIYLSRLEQAQISSKLKLGKTRLGLNYQRLVPWFDANSIWNIFATDPYHEGRLFFRLPLGAKWSASTYGSLQIFESDTHQAETIGAGLNLDFRDQYYGNWTLRTIFRSGAGRTRFFSEMGWNKSLFNQNFDLEIKALYLYHSSQNYSGTGHIIGISIEGQISLGEWGSIRIIGEETWVLEKVANFGIFAVLDLRFSL